MRRQKKGQQPAMWWCWAKGGKVLKGALHPCLPLPVLYCRTAPRKMGPPLPTTNGEKANWLQQRNALTGNTNHNWLCYFILITIQHWCSAQWKGEREPRRESSGKCAPNKALKTIFWGTSVPIGCQTECSLFALGWTCDQVPKEDFLPTRFHITVFDKMAFPIGVSKLRNVKDTILSHFV